MSTMSTVTRMNNHRSSYSNSIEMRMIDGVFLFDSISMPHNRSNINNGRGASRVMRRPAARQDSILMPHHRSNIGRASGVMRPAARHDDSVHEVKTTTTTITESSCTDSVSAECSICLGVLSSESGSKAIIRIPQPCSHMYHLDCITKWLTIRNTCPLCRRTIHL